MMCAEKKKSKKETKKKKKKVKKKKKSKKVESSDSDSSLSQSSEEDVNITDAVAVSSIAHTQPKQSDEFVGPKPISDGLRNADISYGSHLMKGEGEQYAKFVQDNKRIPRRGEVGMDSKEIEHFEDLGYVMSGSRHKRMNAIRIRKENQVYTAEEKRALAIINHEEKAKRENKIMADFRQLLAHKDASGEADEGKE